jgi:hypothetical protein
MKKFLFSLRVWNELSFVYNGTGEIFIFMFSEIEKID